MSAVIIGIEGTMLLAQEAALLHRPFCAGVILFSRNYSSPAQLKRLCATIRAQRPDALICIDHERRAGAALPRRLHRHPRDGRVWPLF